MNVTTFRNPTTQKRIRHALWIARMGAVKARKKMLNNGSHEFDALAFARNTQYVENRKGSEYLRVTVFGDGNVRMYAAGMGNRDVTGLVYQAAIMNATH